MPALAGNPATAHLDHLPVGGFASRLPSVLIDLALHRQGHLRVGSVLVAWPTRQPEGAPWADECTTTWRVYDAAVSTIADEVAIPFVGWAFRRPAVALTFHPHSAAGRAVVRARVALQRRKVRASGAGRRFYDPGGILRVEPADGEACGDSSLLAYGEALRRSAGGRR